MEIVGLILIYGNTRRNNECNCLLLRKISVIYFDRLIYPA